MKVIDLENSQLDRWVAKAEGIEVKYTHAGEYWRVMDEPTDIQWIPHKDWKQGGPIIEREGIGFYRAPSPDQPDYGDEPWIASDARDAFTYRGSTPLVAAMRVFVASRFGEDLPDI